MYRALKLKEENRQHSKIKSITIGDELPYHHSAPHKVTLLIKETNNPLGLNLCLLYETWNDGVIMSS